ncbi:MAG: hypothetical protein IJN22_05135 [Clostridia bacterium]|nr:hypothetical protein [Clostridia bacterium]
MSYIYSKADSKRVYVDPEGTISKYQVRCTNQEEFNFKNNGYLMLYLTQNKFILRSFYNPDIFCIKGYGNVYLEIPFKSIIRISCCGEDFSRIISLSDYLQSNARKSEFSIEFTKNDGTTQNLDFTINCYISLTKNVRECQELIDLYNKITLSELDIQKRVQDMSLLSAKTYLHCPILNIDGIFLFRAFNDRFEFVTGHDNLKKIVIQLTDIVSFTHEQTLKGMGSGLKQDNFLKLIYKDSLYNQITLFIKFNLINNSYPKDYIDFMTKITDLGLIK